MKFGLVASAKSGATSSAAARTAESGSVARGVRSLRAVRSSKRTRLEAVADRTRGSESRARRAAAAKASLGAMCRFRARKPGYDSRPRELELASARP